MKIGIVNGPNLNLLGTRQREVYGGESFEEFLKKLKGAFPQHQFSYFQSNHEGELVDEIHTLSHSAEAIILNPGAFTHTSIALADAVAGIDLPVYEVHISNIYKRENFRKHSYISAVAKGVISGLGLTGYELAVRAAEQ